MDKSTLPRHKGRPADPAGRSARELRVYDFLDGLGVPYERIDHEPVRTMEDCEAIDRALEAVICKNLFLANRQGTRFYLYMMPENRRFRTKDLSAALGCARLSFGSAEDMLRLLDLLPGSVSVMGLICDRDCEVQLVIDREVLQGEYIGCHPCVNTSSLRLRTADLTQKILPGLRHEPVIVKGEKTWDI